MSCLETIQVFLERRQKNVENTIHKIEKHIVRGGNDDLNTALRKIAKTVSNLHEDEQRFTENHIHGIMDLFQIYFDLFDDDFQFGDILRQVLKVCGLILSCICQVSGIEDFIFSYSVQEEDLRLVIINDIRELIRFAIFLNGLEQKNNILEKHIKEMNDRGKFCEEFKCLAILQERAKTDSRLMVTTVKVSIFQLSMLWQMYAVAKLPGHSDITSNYLRQIIQLHKKNDIKIVKTFIDCSLSLENTVDLHLITKYLACLGTYIGTSFDNDFPETAQSDITKLSARQKLKLIRLVVVPHLENILRKHLEWLKNKT